MVEKGAVSAYIKLLRSTDELVQINAIAFLQVMAFSDEPLLQTIIKEGAIQPLVRILNTKSTFSTKARKSALGAIESLCFSSKNSVNILMSHRFLDRLLFLLRGNEVSLKESAVKSVLLLRGTSEEAMKAMGDAGFMSELLTLLDANCFRIREMTAEALSGMLKVPRNKRRFMEEDSNTSRILQLLDPKENKLGDSRFLLSILLTLTNSNSGRKKIAISSHLENLERLAEAEVMEAKKIIKKLSTNRFRSILNGIWNTQV
ncbi:hypothetical protein IFM89_008769 [Coptis chinensis]|uniref:Uncharacterized protein n=1 Tax=Coptis chinensis TaxID=261450 RepID=A0A835LE10_9MAGN|nr:hypothetical protein IFM89_008769 [Coptis chinensis]